MPIKMTPPVSSLTGQPYAAPDLGSATSPLGMVGGLPEGLNPQAINELLQRMNLPSAPVEDAFSKAKSFVAPMGQAFKDNQVTKYISNYFNRAPAETEAIQRAIKGLK